MYCKFFVCPPIIRVYHLGFFTVHVFFICTYVKKCIEYQKGWKRKTVKLFVKGNKVGDRDDRGKIWNVVLVSGLAS